MLDCADGQVARLKGNGTRVGRIIDGLIDYVTAFAGFFGIGVALMNTPGYGPYYWFPVVIGGSARAFQNMYFDYYRNLYMQYGYQKVNDVNTEMVAYEKFRKDLKKKPGHSWVKLLTGIYIWYSKSQTKVTSHIKFDISPEEYRNKNRVILRWWSWLGSTTHISALIVFTLFFRPDLYFWVTLTLGNVMLIIFMIIQKKILKTIPLKQ
jgi:hypothetical protein